MIFLIYADAIWRLNDVYIEIGQFRNFLGGHKEVFVESYKEVLEQVDDELGTQESICGVYNYHNVLGGGCLKGVKSMVYDMLDKAQGVEDWVDYCISLAVSRCTSLNPMEYIHAIVAIGGRLYADGKGAELEPG